MQCPRCRTDNREGRRFCAECGRPLAAPCPACRFPNEPGEQFCGGCGRALGAPAEPPAPEAYTPEHLAERIRASRRALEGERKQVTVLFADLKGSMELLADRDPEEARRILDPVLERMMEAVHRYEGTVNQVMGDGIMALFGAPLAHEDHAVRACYAALRMQEAIARYGEETQRQHGVPVQIRVGLNSGEVVVRAIGSDLHMDYTAVGQTTHLAARMEQVARPGTVLATGRTVHLAEGYVQARALGPVAIKGLDAPVEAFELVGAESARSRLRAATGRGRTRFVDREAELERLGVVLERSRAGHGQVVAIVGEPGVGKSRLAWELARSPAGRQWLRLEACATAYGKTVPWLVVVDMFKAFFRIEPHEEAASLRRKVTEQVLGFDAALGAAVPVLLELFDLDVEDPEWKALAAADRRQRILEGLTDLVLRASSTRPLLLIVENLQWIDAETQALLDVLVERLPDSRLLLLVSYRPGYRHGWTTRPYYTEIRLDPLSPEMARALLEPLLGADAALSPLKRLLIDRTEGNPFFLEESVRALVEGRVLEGEPGAHRLARPLGAVEVPPTVQAVLAARIDRLPTDEKWLLQVAAVIGRDVPFWLLETLAELPEPALRLGLAHLQAAEYLYETRLYPEPEYTFRHALTHDVAYASLLHGVSRALHARVVEAIEARCADRLAEHVEALAHHAARGELWAKAIDYLRQAAARAAARAANQEALGYLEQALQALRRLPESVGTVQHGIDIRLEMRPPLLQLGRLDEALGLSREAVGMAQRIGDERRLARVYTYLVNHHYLKGEPDLAVDFGERCIAIGEATGDAALQVLARRYMGHSYHAQGAYRLAESILRQNLERLAELPAADEFAQAGVSHVASDAWLAFSLAELGEFDAAQVHVERAERSAEAGRHAYTQAMAWTLGGLVAARRGHLERAVPLLERGLAACRDKQLLVWRPIPSSLLGLALVYLGDEGEGLRLLREAVTLSRDLGIRAYLALWKAQLAEGVLLAGDASQARAAAAEALADALACRERGHQAWALRVLAEAAAALGEPAPAREYWAQALALASELGMRPLLAHCHLGLGTLGQQQGDRLAAEEHLAQAAIMYCEMDMRYWLSRAGARLKALGRLFIVARYNPALYESLRHQFEADHTVEIILDRRARGRPDCPVDVNLRSRGLVIVSQPAEPRAAGA